MEKLEFLELLKVENVYSLMSSSEIEKRPVIDLFDYTKSDHDKICDFIKTEFNYAYNVIIGSYNGGRKLVLKEFKNIRNKYLKVSHVLTDEEIHIIALDMFLNLFVGMDGDYLLFVMEYLEELGKITYDKEGYVVYIWNPELISKYKNKKNLRWNAK